MPHTFNVNKLVFYGRGNYISFWAGGQSGLLIAREVLDWKPK